MTEAAVPEWTPVQRDRLWAAEPPAPEVGAFHRGLTGYAPTPLVELPGLAQDLGLGRVLAKCETSRLGLPAFKSLGASWAIHRALEAHPDGRTKTIVTATDGNHGRAVAHFAARFGHAAEVLVPRGVSGAAIAAIQSEGAEVRSIDGDYDEAVAQAARHAHSDPDRLLVQDTAWEGYTEVPGWIVEGYETMLAEVDQQLGAESGSTPDLVLVPTGVGSLLQAVLSHYRPASVLGEAEARSTPHAAGSAAVVGVEPTTAACLPPSLAAGQPVSVETGETSMAGLNCGTLSTLAWPLIQGGLDGAVTVTDESAVNAARALHAEDHAVDAGPCGGASLAGLRAIASCPERREHLRLGPESTIVLLITEGTGSNPLPPQA